MKKLLLILFIIPTFIYGQDVPLTEKKVTTESMENKERKLKEKADDKVRKENTKRTNKYNRSLAMHPKNQIGYIMNPSSCPYGINYYTFNNTKFGWYFDYRNDFGTANDFSEYIWGGTEGFFADRPEYYSLVGTELGGYHLFNIGAAIPLIRTKENVFLIYVGIGSSTRKNYDIYDYVYDSTLEYVRNGGVSTGNFNFGILRQTSSVISWQVGFDSAVPGINFGMGFTWN